MLLSVRRSIPYVALLAILFFGALMAAALACLATLTAPLHSPVFAAEILCPPGSQVESEWYRATFNEPGERTLSVTCVDSQGNPVPANTRDGATLFNGIRLYFPVLFLPVLVFGGITFLIASRLLTARRQNVQPPVQ